MSIEKRIQRAETELYGEPMNAPRILELANAGKTDELTNAELNWLIEQCEMEMTPEARAELDSLLVSLSFDDLTALSEGGTPSAEGQAIAARIEQLLTGGQP